MKYLPKIKRFIFGLEALPLIILALVIVLVTVLLLSLFNFIDSKVLIGFFGIIIGSGISAATSILIAKTDYRAKLAVAALDKRLDAHQIAYALWDEIVGAVHSSDHISDVVEKAQEFWKNNCLYLDAKSRHAFRDCYFFALNHRELLKGDRNDETKRLIKESWDTIMLPGTALAEGISLPSLGGDESDYKLKDFF